MNNPNQFFRYLFSHPALLWKGGAGLLFVLLSFILFFSPSLIFGLERNTRVAFAILLLVYGLFRLFTFYSEYNNRSNEN